MSKQVVVLGGGASGMMAAITAARNGAKTTIIEQNERLGKKILATGNGKCNLTNRYQDISCYRSKHPKKVWQVLKQFTVEDTLQFFKNLGIYPMEKNGYVYPNSGQAASVLDVLRFEVERLGIKVLTETVVKEIKVFDCKTSRKNEDVSGYILTIENKEKKAHQKIQTDSLIFATGSKAGNISGADGSGYELARKLGLHIVKPLPALVQLKCRENFYKSLSGVRVQGKVTLLVDEKNIAEDIGEIQLTACGISGIPVFQVSRFASQALNQGKKVTALLDFAPEFSKEGLLSYLKERREKNPERTSEEFLLGFLNKKLSHVLLKNANLNLTTPSGAIPDSQLEKLVQQIKTFQTEIVDTNGFPQAQVCCGGVSLKEVEEHLESIKHPGIFFAGECLDVDGICGGYNLQWAWSSGYVAGKNAAE